MEQWDHLRLFLAVARRGTLSAAAEDLGVNASTLHRHLGALEQGVNTPLFAKTPRGYNLTGAGVALLPRAEEVEKAVYAAQRTVLAHEQQASGDVRITLPLDFLPVVGRHLIAFREVRANVHLTVLAADEPRDLGREADIALRPGQHPSKSAIGRKLFEIAWCRYAPITAHDDELPWLHYLQLDHLPPVAWRKKTFPAAEPLLFVASVTAMQVMLRSARAQGLLPCFLGDPDPQLRRVGSPPDATISLWLLIHTNRRNSARLRALRDFLVPRLLEDRPLFEGRGGFR